MKRKLRFSLTAAAGILLIAAGLAGLGSGGRILQYAFLPSAANQTALAEGTENVRTALGDAAEQIALHGMKSGVTLTGNGTSQNDVCLYAVGPGWNEIYPRAYFSGRPVSPTEAETGAMVVVLDRETAFKMFGGEDAVGRTVTLNGKEREVIGVAEHGRRIGETGANAAWIPLDETETYDLMVLSTPEKGGSGRITAFGNAAEQAFGTGTVISLDKERTRGTMILRWIGVILAVWLLRKWIRMLGNLWRRESDKVRAESRKRYAGKMIVYTAGKLLPLILLTAVTAAGGYLIAVLAVRPAEIFPEWVPESLGDFSKWIGRFWNLTGEAAKTVTMKTPELAEIRFWSGLVRWGTVLTLTGSLMALLSGVKKNEDEDETI